MGPQVKDGVAMELVGDTLIVVWGNPPTPAIWSWHMAAVRAASGTSQSGVLVCNVILNATTMPSTAMVEQMQRDLRELGPKIRHVIAAPLGTSIWVSMIRTLVRGMATFAGHGRQLSLVDTIEDAAKAAQTVGSPWTPSFRDLLQGITDLQRLLGARSGSYAAAPAATGVSLGPPRKAGR